MVPGRGFEPRLTAPKAAVLPLDDPGAKREKYTSPWRDVFPSERRDWRLASSRSVTRVSSRQEDIVFLEKYQIAKPGLFIEVWFILQSLASS